MPGFMDMAGDALKQAGGIDGLKDQFNKAGGLNGLKDQFNKAGGLNGLKDQFNKAGGMDALTNGVQTGLGGAGGNPMDALSKLGGGAGGNPMDALSKLGGGAGGNPMDALSKLGGGAGGNPMDALSKLGGGADMAGKLLGGVASAAGSSNPSGNPAYDENNGPPGELSATMTSLENKIHKTLENEIANNFTSIIDSILKNPTAQDTMTLAIASALKPSLDNAIANTAYLNEMTNATGDKVKKGLSEFYEEYSTNSEEEKPKAFTSFIDKMKRIQKENVGEVEDMKKALDLLGGDPNFKPNKDIGTRMGTVENQLKTIIPVDAINKKTKTVGGSRKRKQRRRTHKKRRFQPKK